MAVHHGRADLLPAHRRRLDRSRPQQDLHRPAKRSAKPQPVHLRQPDHLLRPAHRRRRLRRPTLLRHRQQPVHRHQHRPHLHPERQHRGQPGQQLRDLQQPRHRSLLRGPRRPHLLRQRHGRRLEYCRRRHLQRLPHHRGHLHHPAAIHHHRQWDRSQRRLIHLPVPLQSSSHRSPHPGASSPAGSSQTRSPTSPTSASSTAATVSFVDSSNTIYPCPDLRVHKHLRCLGRGHNRRQPGRRQPDAGKHLPRPQRSVRRRRHHLHGQHSDRLHERRRAVLADG